MEEVLLALGVNFVLRKLAHTVVPVVELEQDGEYYYFRQYTVIRNREIRFKPEEEFIEETPDGKKVRTIIKFENENKLVQIQYYKDGQTMEIIREFIDDELIVTWYLGDLVHKRYHKAIVV
ncbi:fatty acid-binding protein-like [Culicoides brevitarsis]|uniref:fatty acid-binding protein-like n=1 Tax=Culicoides brevitarsis TaxID=469753 RepID=UPI00307CBF7E